jgi:hypothetical protein
MHTIFRSKRPFSIGGFLAILLILLYALPTNGQTVRITGRIIDTDTKEPVPYASVYCIQAGNGVVSDSVGNFSIHVPSSEVDTLAISYIGYELYKKALVPESMNGPLTIQMKRGGLSNDVVIKTKKINKGLFLWRKIMSKKEQYNRYNLSNFSYEAYNKLEIDLKNFNVEKAKKNFLLRPYSFVFDNVDSVSEDKPFLPAYLIESVSDYAYQRSPNKFFERIKASNTKGLENESITKMLGVMDQNVNLYGNTVTVIDKSFIGPFNDHADLYYNFWVPDTQIVAGNKIFHFVFKPKYVGQNTFEGDAWVTARTFQVKKISLYLGKDANINFVDKLSIFQEFIPLNDSIFFLSRDKFVADFKVLGKKNIALIGRKNTSYKNIVINSDSIAQSFSGQAIKELVTVVDHSNQLTDNDWQNIRHDSLSGNEKKIYATTDRLLQMPKFQQLQRRLLFLGTGYTQVGKIELGPWFNWVSSNQWEGTRLRFDLGSNTKLNKKIYLHGYAAYGTRDQQWKGGAEAYWAVKRKPNLLRLHAAYSNDIDNGISHLGEVSQDNIFSLAIRKPNALFKFLKVEDARFEVMKDLGKGFSTELFLLRQNYTPLENLPFINPSGTAPLKNFEVSLRLRFAYLEKFFEGDFFRYSLGSPYPIVEMLYSQGIAGVLNSQYKYNKIYFSIKDNINIAPLGSLYYKCYAGKTNGTLPFTFLENHPGNNLYYYNYSAFNLMSRFEYLSDQFAGVHLEHSIGSGLFRLLPITRKLKWRQFWYAKSLIGSLSQANQQLNNSQNNFKTLNGKPYIELGTGIDNIFKLIRLDFVWRLANQSSSTPSSSQFGIFGSFHVQF